MSSKLKVGIIVGSTRPGRKAAAVAEWVRGIAATRAELDCEVIGVSRDSVASHAKFRAKHDLPFPLVADIDEAWCKAFDVLGEKTLYGRRFVGVIRSTFLIDASGTLVAEWRGVRVPGHAAAVLERLSAR